LPFRPARGGAYQPEMPGKSALITILSPQWEVQKASLESLLSTSFLDK
jgi:hypothetical protein